MKQRPPIVVGLLFAASLCAGAVALYWTGQWPQSDYADIVYVALLGGYVSVACLWSALRPRTSVLSRSVPLAAVIIASIAYGIPNPFDFVAFLTFFGAHAALLLCALWVFRRSRYWQQRSGTESAWQFSIVQLLAVTTTVALLIVAFQSSRLWNDGGDDTAIFFGFVGSSATLATAAAYLWSRSSHWFLGVAGIFAVALGLGVLFYFTRYGAYMVVFAVWHFLIQAIVLVLWLAWSEILPVRKSDDVAGSES
jgi:hypothetical protein